MPEVKSPKRTAGWTRVAFGDVVRLCTERSSDPEADGFERYIGLEHLDPGELRVRRWGDLADGVTFTNVFRPGQVLFGKRRAYQRKVAVADFSGVCSGDIYVLEPKGDALLPELLPFICQTDAFFEHAVGTSAGSLSPRTNWESLASFEFALPSIEEQRRLSAALRSVQNYSDRLHDHVSASAVLVESYLAHAIAALAKSHSTVPLGTLADVRYGLTVNQDRARTRTTAPYLRVANVQRGSLDLSEVKPIGVLPGDDDHLLKTGDVLIVEGHADPEQIGRAAIWNDEVPGAMHQNHLIRARCGDRLLAPYLLAVVNSLHGRRYFRMRAKSSSGLNTINSGVVRELPIPAPSAAVQAEVANRSSLISGAHNQAVSRRMQLRLFASQILCSAGSELP